MKIRNGFVSNSSSSSFLIYGLALDPDDFKEIVSEIIVNKGLLNRYENEETYFVEKEYSLVCEEPEGFDTVFIGRSWDSVGDNQTGKEFKNLVEKELKQLGLVGDCSTHSESWYG